jgi:hypothetical protein
LTKPVLRAARPTSRTPCGLRKNDSRPPPAPSIAAGAAGIRVLIRTGGVLEGRSGGSNNAPSTPTGQPLRCTTYRAISGRAGSSAGNRRPRVVHPPFS